MLFQSSSKPGYRQKKSPIGEYDESILCAECERKFNELDAFGSDVLISNFDNFFSTVSLSNKLNCYQSSSVDKGKLLRFLISVVWRASVSRRDFYSRIKLDDYEELIAKQFIFENVFSPVFDAILFRWTTNPPTISPCYIDTKKTYVFYMGRVKAYIKVDDNAFPSDLKYLSLCGDGVVKIPECEFEGSDDEKKAIRVFENNPKK